MRPVVALGACATYENAELDRGLETVIQQTFDWEDLFRGRGTVLLKPNLAAPRSPGTAVTTHPRFICAVVRAVRRCYDGRLLLGDSPVTGTASRVARRLDLPRLLQPYDVEVTDFDETLSVGGGRGFGPFELARPLVESDLVINLPKIKTHAQMSLTLAVKNLFGAFIGLDKARWHLHAGRSSATFAGLLLELARRIDPAVTIADGVVGMDGNGPTAGNPRPLGLIAAATDPLALDRVVAKILGFGTDAVPVLAEAARQERGLVDPAPIEVRGEPLERFRGRPWTPARPQRGDATVIPGVLARPLRHQLTSRPVLDHRLCRRCGLCIEHCAPTALRTTPRRRRDPGPEASLEAIGVDLDRCIRCYCCQEVCPEGAVSVSEGSLVKLGRLLGGRRGLPVRAARQAAPEARRRSRPG